MFGDSKSNREEIGKLWERLVPLENMVQEQNKEIDRYKVTIDHLLEQVKRPSDTAEQAQTAFRSISQHKAKIAKAKTAVEEFHIGAKEYHEEIKELHSTIAANSAEIVSQVENTQKSQNFLESLAKDGNILKSRLVEDTQKVESIINKFDGFDVTLAKIETQIEEIGESEAKSSSLLKTIVSNHAKIRDLRDEIIGYEEKDEDGNVRAIEGLQDELTHTYDSLNEDFQTYKNDYESFKETTKSDYEGILSVSKASNEELISTYQKQYEDKFDEINKLLPTALTAGLASAYEGKVREEKEYLNGYKKTFSKAIYGLVAISMIPFAIDLYLMLALKRDLIEILADTPKLIVSILPLYLPVLWIAYSASKKQNLSKRLIEEYTHKGVLSKTYEGLSKQVKELDDETSIELKTKLLFNLLQVNSENPGKLISDYDTTDHPLMDALDKSSRLGDAIERLNNIPGFSSMVKNLETRKRKVIVDENKKVSEVLDDELLVKESK